MPELCFNLWYYLTPQQAISAIAAREYLLDGEDAEKAAALLRLSVLDFRLLPPRPVPAAVTRQYPGGLVPYHALSALGVEVVYADVFRDIQRTYLGL